MKTLLLNNTLIKVISLLFAVMLWFYVSSRGGAERNMVIPLELKNVPSSLVVVQDEIAYADVRIKGRESALRTATPGSIRVTLNLATARAGENVYSIDPAAVLGPKNIKITRINPQQVRIRLEALLKKEVGVLPSVHGRLAAGYRIKRIEVIPSRVTVEGAQGIVGPITQIVTQPVDVTGARDNLSREVPLDLSGKEIRVEPPKPILVRVHVAKQG